MFLREKEGKKGDCENTELGKGGFWNVWKVLVDDTWAGKGLLGFFGSRIACKAWVYIPQVVGMWTRVFGEAERLRCYYTPGVARWDGRRE